MSSEDAKQIDHWMREYASKSDADIRIAMAGWKQHAPGWIAGDLVLQQRARENDPARSLLKSLNEQVTAMAGRLAVMEGEAKKPEYRTWAFWLAVFAFIVGLFALLRDYWDVKGAP